MADSTSLETSAEDDPERATSGTRTWNGGWVDRAALAPKLVRWADHVADAAKAGRWETVLALVDHEEGVHDVNVWRPGGTSWFTPMHQAAWHGAPRRIINGLVTRGGWLTLRTSGGRTPADIAAERGHGKLADKLRPRPIRYTDPAVCAHLDRQLAALVDSRIRPHLTCRLRYPETSVLTEMPEGSTLWFPVPGMYGGFTIQLMRSYLFVQSWSRVVGGSGQAHVVTCDGATLVEQGFV